MIRKKANVLSVGEEFALSRAEAERRLKIEGYPSLEQIIQRTKAKADWPDERWDEIRRIAAAAEKPDALVVNRKTVFAHIRHCNRWVAAASSLIFVLAVLLIFIPESRAFAIQMYHSIIQLFDSRLEIQRPTQAHVWGEYDSQIADDFASELEEEHPQKQEMQNSETRVVTKAGRAVELQPLEFDVLLTLLKNKNLTVSREQLLSDVWGYEYTGETRAVDVKISSLRKKLNLGDAIRAIPKLGYRLEER